MTFIGYTIGLEASRGPVMGKMVKIEYSKNKDGSVKLTAVSGRDLSKMQGHAVIAASEFEDRPQNAYDSVAEAKWALGKCGWSLMSSDVDE